MSIRTPSSPSKSAQNLRDIVELDLDKFNELMEKWTLFKNSRQIQIDKWKCYRNSYQRESHNSDLSNLCGVCSKEVEESDEWCRVCGEKCCVECLVRLRVLRPEEQFYEEENSNSNNHPVPTCQICDEKYLKALIELESEEQFCSLEKQLESLMPFCPENATVSSPSVQRNASIRRLVSLQKSISELSEENKLALEDTMIIRKQITSFVEKRQNLENKRRNSKVRNKNHSFSSLRKLSYEINDGRTCSECEIKSDESSQKTTSKPPSVFEDETVLVVKSKWCLGCNIM